MPPEYKNIAINSCCSWAVQHLTQFSGRYLLTVGLYIAHSHILSCCIFYPTTKTKIKDIIILRSFFNRLRLFILACEHNNQTNGKPSKTAFFLIHTAIVYTAADERRLSLYCLKPLLLRNSVPMLFWYFKVTRQLLELALTCIALEYLRMRLKNHCISFSS